MRAVGGRSDRLRSDLALAGEGHAVTLTAPIAGAENFQVELDRLAILPAEQANNHSVVSEAHFSYLEMT